MLGGPLLAPTAVVGGLLLERALVSPLWNFLMRFASKPAQTLESAVTDEATAVTAFDPNGHGIVSIEVDGQIQQILATLSAESRQLGVRVRAGQRVRIDDVDAERNRCTGSLLSCRLAISDRSFYMANILPPWVIIGGVVVFVLVVIPTI